jgi:1-acyl-sn-glycerol-3-phosphate acyltransferase
MFYHVIVVIARPLCRLLFRPILRNMDNIPATGAAIFAGNHVGIGESFLLPVFAPRPVSYPAKAELFKKDTLFHRIGAWFLLNMRQVPMNRDGGYTATQALGEIQTILDNGGFVAIHPEGHRSPDGRLYKGRTGIARLALATGAPVIPFGCFRTRFTRKKWMPFPWLFRPELVMGVPFTFPDDMREAFLNASNRDQAGEVLRDATDQVMVKIAEITGQEMVDEYSYVRREVGPGQPTN